jgi:crotonobetainyl-CoA:carnitine CoA-transferase CaiB-like acyl-CoA transferase
MAAVRAVVPAGRAAQPEFAEHTDELLAELGFSAAEIKAFREGGVVE